MAEAEKKIDSKIVYQGLMNQVELRNVQIQNHNSQREIVHHPSAVAIIAMTDDDQIYLVRQYRSVIEDFVYEIPAGKIDDRDNDSPEAAAIRELNEEIRIKANNLTEITSYYPTIGWATEKCIVYLAKELTSVEINLERDAGESLDIETVSFEQLEAIYKSGQLIDGKTLLAYYWWSANRK